MRSRKIWMGLGLAVVLAGGCAKPPTAPSTGESVMHDAFLEINGLAYTFSLIHLSVGEVVVNAGATGTIPNEVHLWGRKIYVVNSGNNNIQVINADDFTGGSSLIDVGTGCNPWSLVFQDANTGYCSCLQTNEVLKVDLAGLTVTTRKTIPGASGKYPEGLALANGKLYTAMTASSGCGALYSCGDGTNVAVLDLSNFSGNSFSGIPVHTNPQALAVDSSGRVHVVCTGDYFSIWGNVDVINSGTDVVDGTVTGFDYYSPGLIDIAPNGRGFVAAWGGAFAYDAALLGSATVLDGDYSHGYLGVSHANGNIYFSDFANDQVREFNTTTYAAGRVFNVGHGPGNSVYIP